MIKSLRNSLLAFAGFGLFGASAFAQAPAPAAPAAPNYYVSNGVIYQAAARPYYAATPVYRSTVTTNHAMTGRVSHNFDPSGRGVQLHKPWLRPLR